MGLLKSLVHYIYYPDESGSLIGNKWTAITMADFDQFRSNLAYTTNFGSISTLVTKQTSLPTLSSSSATYSGQSPVDIFKRGIKRDPSVFPTLKDEKFNDQWHRSFANQARAQDVSAIIDALYVPHLLILHYLTKNRSISMLFLKQRLKPLKVNQLSASMNLHMMLNVITQNYLHITLSPPRHR
jgi:hypothetical protein